MPRYGFGSRPGESPPSRAWRGPADRASSEAFPDGHKHDADQQRPQAELKPPAFAFWQVGFGRLGLHGRIIPVRRQLELGFSLAEVSHEGAPFG